MPLPSDCRVSSDKSADNLMQIPLYVICCFSLAALIIFCLKKFYQFGMCLCAFLLGFILYWTLHFLDLSVSFPMLGIFQLSSPQIPSQALSPLPRTSIIGMLVCLMSQKSLRLSLILFSLFVLQQWFPPVSLPIYLFILLPHLSCYCFF